MSRFKGNADGPTTAKELTEDYNWEEAFKCAGLAVEDVDTVERYVDGENDEHSWIAFGQLKDGRWYVLTAWCDYTGWGCQDGGEYRMADTRERLIMLEMDSDERVALLDAGTVSRAESVAPIVEDIAGEYEEKEARLEASLGLVRNELKRTREALAGLLLDDDNYLATLDVGDLADRVATAFEDISTENARLTLACANNANDVAGLLGGAVTVDDECRVIAVDITGNGKPAPRIVATMRELREKAKLWDECMAQQLAVLA